MTRRRIPACIQQLKKSHRKNLQDRTYHTGCRNTNNKKYCNEATLEAIGTILIITTIHEKS
jgi:hypothetical protein